jgi:hypothetical protein
MYKEWTTKHFFGSGGINKPKRRRENEAATNLHVSKFIGFKHTT